MRIISRDKVVLSFSPEHRAVCEVADGESFWVEVHDCYMGQVTDASVRRSEIDSALIDASVGPISVAGARPGDTLCIEVLDIELGEQGVMMAAPGLGVLGDKVVDHDTKVVPIGGGYAHFSDAIRLPLTPMVGVIGVMPAAGAVPCDVPGDHGANMDATVLRVGAKLYLPVYVPGAGLAVGDIHACMGDGELSGTGIETPGRMCLRVSVLKRALTGRPVIEDGDNIFTLASAPGLEEALRLASEDMVGMLMERTGLCFPDAYRLLSALCSAEICQVVNPLRTARVRLPKAALGIESLV